MSFLKKHKYDLIVILAVLIIAGAVYGYTLLTRTEGAEIEISYDGELFMKRSLSENCVLELERDGMTNTVVIKRGAVCVSEASCPDHVCVNSGWKRYDGEMIVCLPNKFVVTIVGGAQSEVDAVTG